MKKICFCIIFLLSYLSLFYLIGCSEKKPTPPVEVKKWTKMNTTGTDLDRYVMSDIHFLNSDEGWVTGVKLFPVDNRIGAVGGLFCYKNGVWSRDTTISLNYIGSFVQFLSSTEGWLGGWFMNTPIDTISRGFLLHYKNGQVNEVTLPNSTIAPCAITFFSNENGWCTGYRNIREGNNIREIYYFLSYRNNNWELVDSLSWNNDDAIMSKPYFLSMNEGWMVGGNRKLGKGILYKYNGNSWKEVPILGQDGKEFSPRSSGCSSWRWGLSDVFFVSPNEGWAVGALSCSSPVITISLIIYYKDGYWSEISSYPSINKNHSLNKVYFTSPTEGWATGSWWGWESGTEKRGSIVFHYQDGKWLENSEVSSLLCYEVDDIYFISPNEGWMIGGCDSGAIIHYKR